MPKLQKVSGEVAIRTLGKMDLRKFASAVVMLFKKKQTPEGEIGCVIPMHKALAVGTLRGILKQARLGVYEFVKNS